MAASLELPIAQGHDIKENGCVHSSLNSYHHLRCADGYLAITLHETSSSETPPPKLQTLTPRCSRMDRHTLGLRSMRATCIKPPWSTPQDTPTTRP
jgi:hypothetical protein